MQSLTKLAGVAAALPQANVDTDMILPARFMKTTSRNGLGRALFHALRYDAQGDIKRDFVLNRDPWDRAIFLIALDNFGCGSSREHAPWALLDFGIRCIIAPSFADIFANNCTKNGILPLRLDGEICQSLMADAGRPETAGLELDLPRQALIRASGEVLHFDVQPEIKRRLVQGLDDIQETLRHEDALRAHDAAVAYPHPHVPIDIGNIRFI